MKRKMSSVYLHVYDLDNVTRFLNKVTMIGSVGAFHAGVEVYGIEWSFGKTLDGKGTGVMWNHPKEHPCHVYRESFPMGITQLSRTDALKLVDVLKREWMAGSYDILRRNCLDFANCMCIKLGVRGVPDHIMRLPKSLGNMSDSVGSLWSGVTRTLSIQNIKDSVQGLAYTPQVDVPHEVENTQDVESTPEIEPFAPARMEEKKRSSVGDISISLSGAADGNHVDAVSADAHDTSISRLGKVSLVGASNEVVPRTSNATAPVWEFQTGASIARETVGFSGIKTVYRSTSRVGFEGPSEFPTVGLDGSGGSEPCRNEPGSTNDTGCTTPPSLEMQVNRLADTGNHSVLPAHEGLSEGEAEVGSVDIGPNPVPPQSYRALLMRRENASQKPVFVSRQKYNRLEDDHICETGSAELNFDSHHNRMFTAPESNRVLIP